MKMQITSLILGTLIALPCIAASTRTTTQYTELTKEKPNVIYVSDDSIKRTLDEMIDVRPELDDDVAFFVKDGVVTLKGTVDNNFERKEAEDIAYSIKGVDHVVNKLISEESGLRAYDSNRDLEYQRTSSSYTKTGF